MKTKIGSTFAAELEIAGLTDRVGVWYSDGKICYSDGATDADRAAVEALLAKHDPNKPEAAAIKLECARRILARVSEPTQRNLTAYTAKLLKDAVLGTKLGDSATADLAVADAIFGWINGDAGMLAACRKLVAGGDPDFAKDEKWPAWDDKSWDTLVARF